MFNAVISISDSCPNSPLANDFSNVAILLVLIKDDFLSPLTGVGKICMSVISFQCIWVVIKQTVMSYIVSAIITAGLNLLPLKSVNGKVIRTMSPLAIVYFF